MKFHENHFDDYCFAVDKENFHCELKDQIDAFPNSIEEFENMVIYGPPGSGKYSQMLYLVRKYSPSQLKYEKKVTFLNEKQTYIYKISDIHYEIDMSLLGCYSRVLWHEIFQQVVDIVSIKNVKNGIIICKNFHCIHNELLEIFYSYMQQYSTKNDQIKLNFILITEHVSFIPDAILNCSHVLRVKRPILNNLNRYTSKEKKVIMDVKQENLTNLKEIYSFNLLKTSDDIPAENFNTICDIIISEMIIHKNAINSAGGTIKSADVIDVRKFRDQIYDILIYNLDALDCVWYIFTHFIKLDFFDDGQVELMLHDISLFITRYGNNYRAIFHIESILFSMICNFRR
jgi:hypothetical protein